MLTDIKLKNIAIKADITINHLKSVLKRDRSVSKYKALELGLASGIHWKHWLFNELTEHKAFRGDPKFITKYKI